MATKDSERASRVNYLTEGGAMRLETTDSRRGIYSAMKMAGLLALVVAALLALAPAGATAAPVFGISLEHHFSPVTETPGVLTRADRIYGYTFNFTNSGPPAAGIAVGDTLKCSTGTWANLPAEYSGYQYAWFRNGAPIAGGPTSNEYTLVAADNGTAVQCVVKATNATGTGQWASVPVTVGTPSTPPPTPPTGTLVMGGTIGAGQDLVCNSGTWTNSPTEYEFQFYRSGVPLGSVVKTTAPTNSAKYTLTATDVEGAAGFQCSIRAINSGGGSFRVSNAKSTSPPPSPAMPNAAGGWPVASPFIPQSTVNFTLPPGVTVRNSTMGNFGGGGWSCDATLLKCTRSTVPAVGVAFPSIVVPVLLDGNIAPDELTASATLSGGGALLSATGEDTFPLAPRPLFGPRYFIAASLDAAGNPYTQAGGHPFRGLSENGFINSVSLKGGLTPVEDPRNISVDLPPGFLGNPLHLPKCPSSQVALRLCPPESQVGTIEIAILEGGSAVFPQAVYAVQPSPGHPAEFAFLGAGVGEVHLYPSVRSDGDYGITMTSPLNTQVQLQYVRFKFWGVPADPIHDSERCQPVGPSGSVECVPGAASSAPLRPLLTNPTNCNPNPQVSTFRADTWENPGKYASMQYGAPPTTGCAALNALWVTSREPSISFQPDNTKADTPSGYDVNIHVPQDGLEDRNALTTPNLYGSTVTLPEGLAISASAANGLAACSEAQMGLTSESPVHFDLSSPACPDASKVGTMEVQTPVLPDPLKGDIYLAAQDANPFHSRYAMYLTIDDKAQGLMLKLAGKVTADPVTGQLKAEFMENPQLPFTDLRLHFFDGPQAALVNPSTCGTYTTKAALTPWSAVDPAHPTAAETATPSDSFTVDSAANGGSCPATKKDRPFAPTLDAGSVSTKAGASTPFVLKLKRQDGQQELTSLNVVTPKGLTASLKGIPYCTEAQIAAAKAKTSGKAEQASPSCPAASQIGSVTTGAGAGSNPLYVSGNAYLAGPYKGAPLSMAIVTPAVAGPFDLGNVVVRAGLYVDPVTAQITVKSDPIPQILEGVPLQVRSVVVKVDRPGFTRNPTSCDPSSVGATVNGASGAIASPSSRFQVGDCSALGFAPKLDLTLTGPTHRSAFPKLKAVLTAREGDANIGRAQVTLPKTEFLEQAHIRTVCTRVQYAARACPAASVYGYAKAWSPLLDQPLEGPVYLRSSDNELPDLVASLDGQIHVDLVGRIDSINARIRNTFDEVPDAPVSKFELTMQGGKKGLLVNNTELCKVKKKPRATAYFTGQNGLVRNMTPVVKADCGKGKGQSKKSRR